MGAPKSIVSRTSARRCVGKHGPSLAPAGRCNLKAGFKAVEIPALDEWRNAARRVYNRDLRHAFYGVPSEGQGDCGSR